MAEILTGGRVVFGIGRGYHTREVESFGSPMLDADANRELSRDYQEAARRYGRELQLGEELILGFRMCIDETSERAIERARPFFEEHAKFMAPLGMLRYSEEHVRAVAARQAQSPAAASLENGVRNRSWLCGPPEEIVGYLREIEQRYPGLEHIMIAWALGTPRALMIEQLTRFAHEVMPAFVR